VGNYSGESMWNVSGVSGAAPVWAEMMNYLHRKKPARKMAIPKNVVRQQFTSTSNIGKKPDEWFIRGTEPSENIQTVKQYNRKILYPPPGAIIALDPDIPPDLQKVFFIAQSAVKEQWKLNQSAIGEKGKTVAWSPKKGQYLLELSDGQGKIIDSVNFEVRGPEEAFTDNDSNGQYQVKHNNFSPVSH